MTTIHARYLASELSYHWRRTVLLIFGVALAASLVVMLDILGRGFADVATEPFRKLGADLIVQRAAVTNTIPKDMGIMLPYSAQTISPEEASRLAVEPGVSQSAGFVLLWNFGAGRFYSISGVSLGADAPKLGPGRLGEWLFKGRLPNPGAAEVVVERHYGAFYRYDPGKTIDIGGRTFAIVGVVDVATAGQLATSNFYMDIEQARSLGDLAPGLVNQVFLKVSDIAATDSVKKSVAAWLPRASISSPGTMLQLFGGVSQTIGRFGPAVVFVGALAALALGAALTFGAVSERRRELAMLRVLGWSGAQVRRQVTAELMVQGLLAGLIALGLVWLGARFAATITLPLPQNMSSENPVNFASGGFRADQILTSLPIRSNAWDIILPPILTTLSCGVWGWLSAGVSKGASLWSAIKGLT